MRCFLHAFVAALCAVAMPGVAAAYHAEDTLRDGSALGNAVGGSFGPAGWTVTDRTDRIWFEIPRLATGSIEFTVANVTHGNLVAEDNEIFAMYEAGYGMVEPIGYSPELRNNHYKAILRIYGTNEPERTGLQKLIWGMCPSGAPGYDECGCGSFLEEPYGGDAAWDGTPQRIRVEWGGGATRLLRNGIEVVHIDWSGTGLSFGPETLHFSIGTSRPDAVGSSSMPIGAVFSDVVVDGVEGPLATCGGASVTPGPDGGMAPADAGATAMASDASAAVDAASPLGPDAGAGGDAGRGAPAAPGTGTVVGGCAAAGARPSNSVFPLVLVVALAVHRRRSRDR